MKKKLKKGGAKTSKHFQILLTRENQAILSIITPGQKWHYSAVTMLSVL